MKKGETECSMRDNGDGKRWGVGIENHLHSGHNVMVEMKGKKRNQKRG